MKACAGKSVLIWGGASSVGLYAIQIAALYGLEVITTCSRKHFDTVKELGASYAFDYNDDNVVEEIKRAAPEIHYVFDTIGKETTSQLASQTIHTSGGTLCTVRPGKAFTENVTKQTKVTDVLVWTAFFTKHQYKGFVWPPNEFDNKISAEFFAQLPELLASGKIKANKTRVLKGLDSIPVGFQEHRDGRISGYKIVYEL
ncbi:hypothetical protein Golomagni_06089 [Golovinomyces magnicellulatus]|nr:hypothetical protein Golomagni_06089 [Golovinomyces magnicellulatus]